jgi:hypothetical protein
MKSAHDSTFEKKVDVFHLVSLEISYWTAIVSFWGLSVFTTSHINNHNKGKKAKGGNSIIEAFYNLTGFVGNKTGKNTTISPEQTCTSTSGSTSLFQCHQKCVRSQLPPEDSSTDQQIEEKVKGHGSLEGGNSVTKERLIGSKCPVVIPKPS